MSIDFDRVTFDNVSCNFGRRRALRGVSLECAAGQILGLLGPNGAGKSTLLAIAATQLGSSSGEVRYGSHTARAGGAGLRRRIGLLAHELQLYAELSARENLEFFANLYGLSDPTGRADRALEDAALGTRAGDLVAGLSRGMRQRLALERVLLHEPRLVLLDEPFTGLDESSVRRLQDRLRRLRADGRIIVLATHDLGAVHSLLDCAAMLRDGRLENVS